MYFARLKSNVSSLGSKTSRIALLLSIFCVSAVARAEGLQPGDVVAITGDSITEQKNYSVIMEEYLLACQPAPKLRTVQFGWGGERAPGLQGRLANDVLPFKPTVATTCYGMNDGGYGPINDGIAKTYRGSMAAIVQAMKKAGVRFIVVGTPGVVDVDTYGKGAGAKIYNPTLKALGEIAREIATAEGVGFADVHGAMFDAMTAFKAKNPGKPFAGNDGVHPGDNGHLAMAYAFLKGLGCDGNIGTITVDLATGKATGSEGHDVAGDAGGVTVVSSRWPFVLKGDPKDPLSQIAAAEFVPFNQDLNRLQLVVTNAPAGKVKVTWGGQDKEFDAADLAKGVNLAAEFPVNPFAPAWAKLDAAVRAQQGFETPMTKDFITKMPAWSKLLPDEQETFDRLRVSLVKRQATLSDVSVATISPVTHTIKIEAVK